MSDYDFNKTQYKFFAKHLKADLGRVKRHKSCEWMASVHRIGQLDNEYWHYTESDRAKIIALAKKQLEVDLLFEPYPEKQSRYERSAKHTSEKENSLSVTHDFVLVNTLDTLRINHQCIDISLIDSLGLYVNTQNIISIEHKTIVLVENLTVMANLHNVILSPDAEFLKEALWLYRGDVKAEQSTGRAYQFFKSLLNSHELVCFPDFDPEGFKIAIGSQAFKILSPSTEALVSFNVSGSEKDFYNQTSALNYICSKSNLSIQCQDLIQGICNYKKTIKQEHILSHQIPLMISSIY